MARSRRRRARRATAPLRRISIPKNPVAVATSVVKPRIGSPWRRRNEGPKRRAGPKISLNRRRPPGRQASHTTVRSNTRSPTQRRLRNRHALVKQPCIKKPNSRLAAKARWDRYGRGQGKTPTEKRNEEFRRWC